ncbi:mesenchyme-specific cell surface glycoprotein-like [Mytilus trossulus]|uniref:mesenchyme-specific cell surface glycoprotein-like n=1 Tax=Mytilus trossulus TaxID=6551 RepID=UPI003004B2A1
MRALLILLLSTPFVLSILQFRERGYIRLPYNTAGTFGFGRNGATKARYHAPTRMLYVIGTGTNLMHIIELTNPDTPAIRYTHEFNSAGDGEITDVQVCSDSIAVSIASNNKVSVGHVELFLPFTKNDNTLTRLGRLAVGSYPKDMSFNNDCSRLVVVNEGKLGLLNGVVNDPQGSMTIIVRNDQGFPPEVNVNFQSFDNRVLEYVSKGVRYVFRGDSTASPPIEGSFSKDLEPESVVIDDVGRYAYISLQENNAILKFDLTNNQFIDIYPLGVKNWTSFDMDASDRDGGPNMKRHNIYSFYQPRDLKYGVINGQGYLLTANTGAMKQWSLANDGYEFSDGMRARALRNAGEIDEALVGADVLAKINNDADLGRLHIGIFDGLNNNQQLIRYPHSFGGRSVAMWNSVTFQRVYDTGDDLEREAMNKYPITFNGETNNVNLSPSGEMDLRSDDYGVEPTALDIGSFNGAPVMVTASRSGFIYVYNVVGTALSFQSVHRRGGTSQTWNNLYSSNQAGDALITDIGYMDETMSPSGQPMAFAVGSASSSIGLYDIYDDGNTK